MKQLTVAWAAAILTCGGLAMAGLGAGTARRRRRLWAGGDGRPHVLGAQSLVPGRFPVPPDAEPRSSTGDVGHERLPHLLPRCPGPGQPRSRHLRRPQSATAADSSASRAVSAAAAGDVLEHVDTGTQPRRLTTRGETVAGRVLGVEKCGQPQSRGSSRWRSGSTHHMTKHMFRIRLRPPARRRSYCGLYEPRAPILRSLRHEHHAGIRTKHLSCSMLTSRSARRLASVVTRHGPGPALDDRRRRSTGHETSRWPVECLTSCAMTYVGLGRPG